MRKPIEFFEEKKIKIKEFLTRIGLSDANFEECQNKATKPVVVFFWTPWFGPCWEAASFIEEFNTTPELSGRVLLKALDVNEGSKTFEMYDVQAVPSFMLFKNGKACPYALIGTTNKADFRLWLDDALDWQPPQRNGDFSGHPPAPEKNPEPV